MCSNSLMQRCKLFTTHIWLDTNGLEILEGNDTIEKLQKMIFFLRNLKVLKLWCGGDLSLLMINNDADDANAEEMCCALKSVKTSI